jgi:hypothetical protein
LHFLAFLCLQLPHLTFTCMHSYPSALMRITSHCCACAPIHSHALALVRKHLHSLHCTSIHSHSLQFISLRFHYLAVVATTCTPSHSFHFNAMPSETETPGGTKTKGTPTRGHIPAPRNPTSRRQVRSSALFLTMHFRKLTCLSSSTLELSNRLLQN